MVYELSRFVFRLVFNFYFRWEVYGRENIIGAKGGIIAVNHASFLDPALVGVGVPSPRKIYYVAKKDLFVNPFVGWYFNKLNAVPLDRDKLNIATLRKMIRLIERGDLIVMFPEGTRSIDNSLGEGYLGTGLLAAKTRAMIYPCYIMGAKEAMPKGARFFRPRKIRIMFGKPVRYDDLYDRSSSRAVYAVISRSIMEEIGELKRRLEARFAS